MGQIVLNRLRFKKKKKNVGDVIYIVGEAILNYLTNKYR